MTIEQLNAEILENAPPIILGATRDVIPDTPVSPDGPVVGLPLAIFRPVLNQLGVLANAVQVLIDPPTRDDPSDDNISIALWLNGTELENRPIPVADRDRRSEFELFELSLNDGRNNKLEYKVHRPSGNDADSIPLWILYSAQLPGGNIVPGDDEHPYLDISLPPELGDPPLIGKDEVDKGVPLTLFYPYMKAYDVITVRLQNSDFALPPLLPAEVDRAKVVTIVREVFEGVGSSPEFEFSYTVVDQLHNPTERRRWSKILKAFVDVDQMVLEAPILREDPNEATDDPAIVDRDKLDGAPLLVVVLPKAPQFVAGDRVEGRFTGMPSGEDAPFTGTIETDGFGQLKPCIMQIPNNQVVLDDQVRASYTLLRAGSSVGVSKPAIARVIGAGAITLDPPTLVAPAVTPIEVLAYPSGVTVRVTFAGNPGDKAQLKENNPPSGATAFPAQDIIAGQSDFTLSPAFLAARQGIDIELTWELIRGGTPIAESGALWLRVNRMADGDTRLPTPTITAVTDGLTLDLASFTGNTNVLINAWPGIAVGQRLWLRCEGTNNSGGTVTLPIHQGVPITSTGNQGGVVTRAFLDQLADSSSIRVYAAVNFDGVANETTAVKFPLRTYTIRAVALVAPTITSVKGSPSGVEIPHDGITTETSVILTGAASKGQKVQVLDGTTPKGEAVANATTGIWTLTVTGLSVAAHSFTAKVGSGAASQARTLTVTAVIVPTLTSVKGSPSDVEIPEDGTTVETTLKLAGKASNGQTVEVFDGSGASAVSKGPAVANAAGDWQLTITVALGAHRLYAQSKYHSSPVFSNVRTLTVIAVITPTITSVKNRRQFVIREGATTTTTTVLLAGTATPGQYVDLVANGRTYDSARANTQGDWSTPLLAVTPGDYSFIARATEGHKPESLSRKFKVSKGEDFNDQDIRELPREAIFRWVIINTEYLGNQIQPVPNPIPDQFEEHALLFFPRGESGHDVHIAPTETCSKISFWYSATPIQPLKGVVFTMNPDQLHHFTLNNTTMPAKAEFSYSNIVNVRIHFLAGMTLRIDTILWE